MTKEQLDAIREREKAATKGPWRFNGAFETAEGYFLECAYTEDIGGRDEDIGFILHARQDVPDLLDEVDRLREELGELDVIARDRDDAVDLLFKSVETIKGLERIEAAAKLLCDDPENNAVFLKLKAELENHAKEGGIQKEKSQ